jgi:hypothetical protein
MGAYEKYKMTRVTADAVVTNAAAQIMAVSIDAPSAASTCLLYDNASAASGTVAFEIAALNGDSRFVDLTEIGGISCANGIYADIGGSGAIVRVWYQ